MAFEPAEIIRIECDSFNKTSAVHDQRARNKEPLAFWRGSDVAFQLAISHKGVFLTPEDAGTVSVELKDRYANPSDPSLWRDEPDIEAGFTAEGWNGKTSQLVTARLPSAITERLIAGHYFLIVTHEGTHRSTHLSHKIDVKEDHQLSRHTYNFGDSGSLISGNVASAQVDAPILSTSEEVTVNVPAGFTASNYQSHVVTGIETTVELSDTVQLNASSITFTVLTPPATDNTHEISVKFQKITA